MFIVVLVTVPGKKVAKRIAEELLLQRTAACINILKDVDSLFWWQGRIDKAKEHLLVIKTRKSLFSKLKKIVERLHPYQVVEIIALPLADINKKYRDWLKKETS
ncbi:MAG TPA: divalent-cation tolerance protein CutA [Candidatus Omnitrophica bacterium]|nr:MAG: divalent-cation tolerance protein CutA [Candidatus Omnitrophota bacterium]RKY44994.1 MAG: divalent-cation tolerance protein CutA [Candidatus Omnitrophota bacterium]HEC69787.1 divalent-cation tolerance protein CutA [Candidatus Omnitrophota bacterium]